MEGHVRAAHAVPLLREEMLLGLGESSAHQLHGGMLGLRLPERRALDHAAGAVDVDDIGDRRRSHRDATVRDVLDEPLFRQHAERLPQRVARDLEPLGQRRL